MMSFLNRSKSTSYEIVSATFVCLAAVFLQYLIIGVSSKGARCRFPSEWRGRYFQSGLGNIIIRDGFITTKGTCVEQHKDYFLFANRENSCFQCLLIIHRHPNVLQYKESFCLTPDSLKPVCAQIRIETPLYTLVRDPASPIVCPFQDAYYFNYNDQQHGFCNQPISYAKPCAGFTKYQFHFQHCMESANLNGKDLGLECLATWKDGSESYLYSRITAAGIIVKDDQYRCFNYQRYGSEVFLSMSVDATCRGLKSARDGQFVLEFTKDVFGWPSSSCLFPNWMQSVTWRDLEGKYFYRVDEEGQILSEFYIKKSKQHRQIDYRCTEIVERDSQNQEVTVRSFSTHGCISKLQCLRLRQKSSDVIEIQTGSFSDFEANSRCLFTDYYRTLMSNQTTSMSSVCPSPGFYKTTMRDGCVHHLSIGCQNSNVIVANLGCNMSSENGRMVSLECMTPWRNQNKMFVVLRKFHAKNHRLSNCFSFSIDIRPVTFEMDKMCNKDASNIDSGLSSMTFYKTAECIPSLNMSFMSADKFYEQIDNMGEEKDKYPMENVFPLRETVVTQSSYDDDQYDDDDDVTDTNYDVRVQTTSLKQINNRFPDVIYDVTTILPVFRIDFNPDMRIESSDPLPYSGGETGAIVSDDDELTSSLIDSRRYKDRLGFNNNNKESDTTHKSNIDVWDLNEKQKEIIHIHLLNENSAAHNRRSFFYPFIILLTIILDVLYIFR